MQQVAIPQSKSTSSPAVSRQTTACLRLSRGASAQATWLLEDVPGGTTITVGADETCDWHVRAACVPEQALVAMMIGGTLFMKSAHDGAVLLDGRPLPLQWTEVPTGSRVDIGLARIEVALGQSGSAFEKLPQAYVPVPVSRELPYQPMTTMEYQLDPQDAQGVYEDGADGSPTATLAELTSAQRTARAVIMEQGNAAPVGYSEGASDPSVVEGTRPSMVEGTRPSMVEGTRPSLFERLTRPSLLGAPSLLEDGAREGDGPNIKKLALAGLVTACAYAGWLVLLDHL